MSSSRPFTSWMGYLFIAVGLLLLIVVCVQVVSHAQGGPQERTRQAIRQVLEQQAADWNRGDLPAFMAGYHNSPELSFFSDKDTRGWQATLERFHQRYQVEKEEMGTLSFSDLEIDLLGPDSAVVRGRWQLVQSKGMSRGLFTLIFRKLPEGWRIVHDHTSQEPPSRS